MAAIIEQPTQMDEQEERHFFNLFQRALETYVQNHGLTGRGQDIDNAIEAIKAEFVRFNFNTINFDSDVMVVAYFARYSTLNTSVTRKRCLRAIENCEELQKIMQSPNLKIVSLGGGPGTDMIGFLSAMRSFMSGATSLDLIVSDKWLGWKELHDYIQNLIIKENFGNVTDIYRNSHFMQIDLLNTDFQIIQSADIVLLVRVLGILSRQEENQILTGITNAMKSGALLFIVDTKDEIRKRFRARQGLDIIYLDNNASVDHSLSATQGMKMRVFEGEFSDGFEQCDFCTSTIAVFKKTM